MASADNIIERMREAFLSRGGVKGLSGAFKKIDTDGNKNLSKKEFIEGIEQFGLTLSREEVDTIFEIFDNTDSKSIDFDEFVKRIQPPLTEVRRKAVDEAFKKADKTGDGVLKAEDLRGIYNAKSHPHYRSGKWTEDQVIEQYLGFFEGSDRDGEVTKGEFEIFYNAYSAMIDDDDVFVKMVTGAWQ